MTDGMEHHEPTTHEKLDWKLDSITKMLGDEKMSESFDSGALMGMLANKGVDPAMLACMNNGGFGGNNGWLVLLFLIILGGRGGFGNWGDAGLNDIAKNSTVVNEANYGRLMDAIGQQGIRQENAISQLATQFNCKCSDIQMALAGVDKQIAVSAGDIRAAVGAVSTQIVASEGSLKNAIQQCCCNIGRSIDQASAKTDLELCKGFGDVKSDIQATRYLITAQGAAQDAMIAQKFADQNAYLAEKFCEIKNREDQREIQALRDKLAEKDRDKILAAVMGTKSVSGTLSSSAGTWSGTSTIA